MKILLTGAGGFVGGHLTKLLVDHDHEVYSLGQGTPFNIPSQKHIEADILDKDKILESMKQIKPDAVFHLAALSNVPYCWQKPEMAVSVNVCGMLHVLESFAKVRDGGMFVSVGSSDAYGLTAKIGRALSEDNVCLPQNPYAISKLCAEQMALQIGKKCGVKVIHTRSFNHFGPGQALGFVVSDFACQIADIEAGKIQPVLSVGDLSAARDFTYVADVAAAYTALVEKDVPAGVYNVCSGRAVKIQDILDGMLSLSCIKVEVTKDPQRLRPSDVPFFVGDGTKIREATGWHPEVPLDEGLKRVLAYWRERQ